MAVAVAVDAVADGAGVGGAPGHQAVGGGQGEALDREKPLLVTLGSDGEHFQFLFPISDFKSIFLVNFNRLERHE